MYAISTEMLLFPLQANTIRQEANLYIYSQQPFDKMVEEKNTITRILQDVDKDKEEK